MQPRDVIIVSACRTAIGKFQGQFKDVPARELAITAGKEAIRRAGVDINTIDEIVMGECYTAMQGSLPARQVSMRIGLPIESSAVTVNQNCASGMRALDRLQQHSAGQDRDRPGGGRGKYDPGPLPAAQSPYGLSDGWHPHRGRRGAL